MVTKKLFLLLSMALAISVISCTNDSQDEFASNGTELSEQTTEDANTVITDKGELIHLEDTTVYTVKLSDITSATNSEPDVWSSIPTRASNDSYPKKITIKGFDRKEQFGGYKKMIFSGWESTYFL